MTECLSVTVSVPKGCHRTLSESISELCELGVLAGNNLDPEKNLLAQRRKVRQGKNQKKGHGIPCPFCVPTARPRSVSGALPAPPERGCDNDATWTPVRCL